MAGVDTSSAPVVLPRSGLVLVAADRSAALPYGHAFRRSCRPLAVRNEAPHSVRRLATARCAPQPTNLWCSRAAEPRGLPALPATWTMAVTPLRGRVEGPPVPADVGAQYRLSAGAAGSLAACSAGFAPLVQRRLPRFVRLTVTSTGERPAPPEFPPEVGRAGRLRVSLVSEQYPAVPE
jgi:hypothetical protein